MKDFCTLHHRSWPNHNWNVRQRTVPLGASSGGCPKPFQKLLHAETMTCVLHDLNVAWNLHLFMAMPSPVVQVLYHQAAWIALLAVCAHVAVHRLKLYHTDKRHTFKNVFFCKWCIWDNFNARDMSGVTVEFQEDSQRSLEATLGDAQKFFCFCFFRYCFHILRLLVATTELAFWCMWHCVMLNKPISATLPWHTEWLL